MPPVKKTKRTKRGKSSDKKKPELFDGVDKFYNGQRADIFKKPGNDRSLSAAFILRMLIISVLGFCSGLVAILLVITGTWQVPGFSIENLLIAPQTSVTRSESVTVVAGVRASQLVERSYQSVLGLYPVSLAQGKKNFFSSNQAVRQAIVLTSDGWLATVDPRPGELAGLAVLDSEKIFHEIVETVIDPASNIIFIKVDAKNLKPIRTAQARLTVPLEELVILKSGLTLQDAQTVRTTVLASEFFSVEATGQQSSESYSRALAIEKDLDEKFAGSLVLNLAGEAVGIVQPGKKGLNIFPLKNLDRAIFSLLREGVAKRTYLGVRFFDLSFAAGLPAADVREQRKGAWLFSGTGFGRSVIADSPAERAGLNNGDIILRVEDDIVNGRAGLTELIQEYRPGDKVILTVLRSGDTIDLEVELADWPAEDEKN